MKLLALKVTEEQKGVLAIVLIAVIWGLMNLFPRFLNSSFLLFQQVYLRMSFGFLFSLLFFREKLNFSKLKTLPAKEWGFLVFRALFYYLFGVVLFTKALLLTKISNVSFIGAIPMTAILGLILFGEKLSLPKFLLILSSFAGVLLISVKDFSSLSGFSLGKGELFMAISTVFLSLGMLGRRWQGKILNDQEIGTLVLFFASLSIFAVSLGAGEGLPLTKWTGQAVLVLLLAGSLNACLSFLLSYGFSRVEPILANNLLALESAFSTLLAFLVFREFPIFKEILGGLATVGGAILMNQVEAKEKKK